MILYLIPDLNEDSWQRTDYPEKIFNDLILFINTFQTISYSNHVNIVANKKIIFSTQTNNMKDIFKSFKYTTNSLSKDLSFILCLINKLKKSRCINENMNKNDTNLFNQLAENSKGLGQGNTNNDYCIMLYNFSEQNDFVSLLKSSNAAYKMGIKINVFSAIESSVLTQVCLITNGKFCKYTHGVSNVLDFFRNDDGEKLSSVGYCPVDCLCHGKNVSFGLVCPICLAVYCKMVPICKRCKTKIDFSSK